MANILILDDDRQLCDALSLVIRKMGHEADAAYDLKSGFEMCSKESYDVIILDIRLPDGNGLEALPKLREGKSAPEVIILSGAGDPDGAELAIRSGAWSYIPKPPTLNKIQLPVQRAIEYRHKKRSIQPPVALKRHGIIGDSLMIQACLDMVAQASATDANVLITGETGTGKELFARAIHENSPRGDRPFVVVDCAAMPEKLVESMLFGHEKGAFTGADRKSEGLIKQAHSGVLFLDEIGELPISMQKSFLRVLQEHRFRPLGGRAEEKSDFRLIAATNRDLEQLVAEWKFRQDLLFRLRTISIELPPLRERPQDVKTLANHYIDEVCGRFGLKPKGAAPEFFDTLLEYDWPGNVRELVSAVESSITTAGAEPILYPRHLPTNIRVKIVRTSLSENQPAHITHESHWTPSGPTFPTLQEFRSKALAEVESQYLNELMNQSGRDIKKACEKSGLSRARLYALLKKYEI